MVRHHAGHPNLRALGPHAYVPVVNSHWWMFQVKMPALPGTLAGGRPRTEDRCATELI